MHFHWPQITYLVAYAITLLLIGVVDHWIDRKPQLPLAIVMCAFYVWLLWCGGFFT